VSPAGGRSSGGAGRRTRRGSATSVRRFPRAARINEVLRQVLAEEIERLVDTDERLTLLTITAVETDRDFRRATLLFSRLGPVEVEALEDARVRLQATVARQVRLKWTPLLSFVEDPAIAGGQRVAEDLLDLRLEEESRAATAPAPVEGPDAAAPVDGGPADAPVDGGPADAPVDGSGTGVSTQGSAAGAGASVDGSGAGGAGSSVDGFDAGGAGPSVDADGRGPGPGSAPGSGPGPGPGE
jgi:ribosome-binding factor A